MDHYDVVVVGAGWAGLSVSYELMCAKINHIVIERGRVGEPKIAVRDLKDRKSISRCFLANQPVLRQAFMKGQIWQRKP